MAWKLFVIYSLFSNCNALFTKPHECNNSIFLKRNLNDLA